MICVRKVSVMGWALRKLKVNRFWSETNMSKGKPDQIRRTMSDFSLIWTSSENRNVEGLETLQHLHGLAPQALHRTSINGKFPIPPGTCVGYHNLGVCPHQHILTAQKWPLTLNNMPYCINLHHARVAQHPLSPHGAVSWFSHAGSSPSGISTWINHASGHWSFQ